MAGFRLSVVTVRGRELLSSAQAGKEIKFTRIEVGDGMPPADPTAMTGLAHSVRSYGIEGYRVDGTDFSAWTTIGSEGNAEGYYLREQGLFAANPEAPDDRAKDVLYAVSVVAPSEGGRDYFAYVPAANGASVVGWRLEMHTIIVGAAQVAVIVGPPTDYATLEDLAAYTPLSMFKPEDREGRMFGRHLHLPEDVDGLSDILADWERRLELLNEMLNNDISGGVGFQVTFWTLDGITVHDGQWVPETGRMTA